MGNKNPEQGLRYDLMIKEALRGVMGEVLAQVVERGLPGSHHLYITFRTGHPGVEMPAALRRRYDGEMTIVLQHQFSGLEAGPEAFAVTLSFTDLPQRLTIPYDAVVSFADPSVKFALNFETDGDVAGSETAQTDPGLLGKGFQGKKKSPRGGRIPETGDPDPSDPDKVVVLDNFRKR